MNESGEPGGPGEVTSASGLQPGIQAEGSEHVLELLSQTTDFVAGVSQSSQISAVTLVSKMTLKPAETMVKTTKKKQWQYIQKL